MHEPVLMAASSAEMNLFLEVSPCTSCGQGPLRLADQDAKQASEDAASLTLAARCAACRAVHSFTFRLSPSAYGEVAAGVNPGDAPSQLIDVAQWLTLCRLLSDAAARAADKPAMRELRLMAGRCLEEAMKFYDDAENDLPPPEAFFHEASRDRLREHPEQFARQRLVEMWAALPHPTKRGAADRKTMWWWQRR